MDSSEDRKVSFSQISPSSEQNSRPKLLLLRKKQKPKQSIEDVLEIYCKISKIKTNEITQKITSLYYLNVDEGVMIDYNKANGDQFPLKDYIESKKKNEQFKIDKFQIKAKDEKVKEKNKKDKEEEEEKSKKGEEEELIGECFLCGWIFLKEMTLTERNKHIEMCLSGKGEENKKEFIDTYNYLEKIKNNEKEMD